MILSNLRIALAVLGNFCRDEKGQDLIEYTLLLALVALCALGLLAGVKSNTSAIWTTANSALESAKSAAS